jgi:hypothetical protein
MSAARSTRKPGTSSTGKAPGRFTEKERAAMREYATEVNAARHHGSGAGEDAEAEVLGKVAEMPERDRAMAERLHAITKASAPSREAAHASARLAGPVPAAASGGPGVSTLL